MKETKIINYAEPLVVRLLILHGSTIIQSRIFLSLIGLLMVQLILEDISWYVKDKRRSKSSQHWFAKGKSCSTNLIAFYDWTAGWTDEERAKDIVYLYFSEVFDTVSHSALLGKPRECGLDEWMVRWFQELAEREISEGSYQWHKASWRSVASGVPPRISIV